jgi:hypothetical protein
MGTAKKSSPGKRASKRTRYALKIKVEGPGVHKKSIAIPDLLKICGSIQTAIHRQAEAMEKPEAQTLRRGPITASAQEECTLELVGLTGGSVGLLFQHAKPQQPLPLPGSADFGGDVIAKVAETIRRIGGRKQAAPFDTDPGVLVSLKDLTDVLEKKKITRISLSVPRHDGVRTIRAVVSAATRQRINALSKVPTHLQYTIEGRLEMADFKEDDKLCRIHPPIGQALVCSFDTELEEQIYDALRRPVRLTGTARLNPNTGRPEELKIEKLEVVDELLVGAKDFFASRSLKQLADAQGVHPLSDPDELKGGWPDEEDIDEFVDTIYQSRG